MGQYSKIRSLSNRFGCESLTLTVTLKKKLYLHITMTALREPHCVCANKTRCATKILPKNKTHEYSWTIVV